jgi:hypothetical protein
VLTLVPKRIAASMALQRHLDDFLAKREPPKTFCPSEVARALTKEELEGLGLSEWREAMDGIRELVWEMMGRGECEVTQKGEVVDVPLEDIRGPIRVRRTA